MAKTRRRPQPQPQTLVRAIREGRFRSACDVPLMAVASSYWVPEGALGILVGPAPDTRELQIVEFDVGAGKPLARVEVAGADIEEYE